MSWLGPAALPGPPGCPAHCGPEAPLQAELQAELQAGTRPVCVARERPAATTGRRDGPADLGPAPRCLLHSGRALWWHAVPYVIQQFAKGRG